MLLSVRCCFLILFRDKLLIRRLTTVKSLSRHRFCSNSPKSSLVIKLNKYLTEQDRMRFLVTLLKESELVGITQQIHECRDPNDNKFLELAVCGNANVLVTGDDDLLVLNPFRGIAVLTPRDFLSFTQPPPP
jgi:putative PIN family toxin of toxin-antitoxin system